MKRIRISVNLIHYFQDHRQLAKIFVKNDMQTIEDLQNHIIKLFNIERNFYLMCQNHYLPSIEDIHILNDNDLIYVIPNLNTEEQPIVKKKKKKDTPNTETKIEVNIEKKSKKKKKQPVENFEIIENNEKKKNEEHVETHVEEEEKVAKKKKKRKKKIENLEQNCPENPEIITNKSSQLTNDELMETSNIEIEISKKKKRKTIEQTLENMQENAKVENTCHNFSQEKNGSVNFEETSYEIPSKNMINETVIFRGSNKFDSIFIRQSDVTEMEFDDNSEYNFVNESRRKRRRCISPGIMPPKSEESEVEANLETNESRNKSIVQTVENLSPSEHNELLQNIKHSPRRTYSLADMLHFNNQISSPSTNEINTILEKSPIRPALRSTRKQLSGVGKVLEYIKIEQESDISENNDLVPKRKRIRTRRRKPKNNESATESNEHSDQSVFIPPKTIAAPKCHIKFEDNLDTNANSVKGNPDNYFRKPSVDNFNTSNGFVHSTPLNKTLENFGETRKISINNINPDELPLMVETPAVKNIILFKKLKLGPDYNPIVSNYILAEIMEIAKNGDEFHLKILEGHEELEDPIGGRFSCNIEDEEQNDYQEIQILERNTLIDPKIVHNFESQ